MIATPAPADASTRGSRRYLDEFLGLRCAPDLLRYRCWGIQPSKEITESMGAFAALRRTLGSKSFGDRDRAAVVVGDGHAPRTGILLAHLTRWRVLSIDPLSRRDRMGTVERLTVRKERWDVRSAVEFARGCSGVALLLVHSHAVVSRLDWLALIEAAPTTLVSIPCCVATPEIDARPQAEYEDGGILSPHRTVRIWQ